MLAQSAPSEAGAGHRKTSKTQNTCNNGHRGSLCGHLDLQEGLEHRKTAVSAMPESACNLSTAPWNGGKAAELARCASRNGCSLILKQLRGHNIMHHRVNVALGLELDKATLIEKPPLLFRPSPNLTPVFNLSYQYAAFGTALRAAQNCIILGRYQGPRDQPEGSSGTEPCAPHKQSRKCGTTLNE